MKKYYVEIDGVKIEVNKEISDEVRANSGESRHERYVINELAPMHELSLDGLIQSDYPIELHMVKRIKSIEEQIHDSYQLKSLEHALSRLNRDEQELIVALFYEGLSERTIAQYIGCAQSTVWYRKQQALLKLKKLLTFSITSA